MVRVLERPLPAALAMAVVGLAMAMVGCSSSTANPSSEGVRSTNSDAPASESTVNKAVGLRADDIAVATTPAGGWSGSMPALVLAQCTEELAPTAPDMRGMWAVVHVEVDGVVVTDHPADGQLQRIEQCGDRVVITGGGIIHDMRSDGTLDGAVRDVAAADFATPITVVSSFIDGTHILQPFGAGDLRITRQVDEGQLVWGYVGFTARLDRLGPGTPDPGIQCLAANRRRQRRPPDHTGMIEKDGDVGLGQIGHGHGRIDLITLQ
jgi:hypothetical protein